MGWKESKSKSKPSYISFGTVDADDFSTATATATVLIILMMIMIMMINETHTISMKSKSSQLPVTLPHSDDENELSPSLFSIVITRYLHLHSPYLDESSFNSLRWCC